MEKCQTKLINTNSEKYGILFDLFRRSSNEEDVLVNKIITNLNQQRKGSLLDIGAGDGSITQKLMPYFDDISGIDRLNSNIYFLKYLGIDTKKCLWEVYQSNQLYDIILASHIMYYFPINNWTKEIIRMEKLLKPNGKIFIIINSQEGEYADFLKKFYYKFHKESLKQIHSSKLVKELKNQDINITCTSIESKAIFENKTHFLSLCKFLLDYDFNEKEPIKNELNDYFNNLSPIYENGYRKKMTILEDFITINK